MQQWVRVFQRVTVKRNVGDCEFTQQSSYIPWFLQYYTLFFSLTFKGDCFISVSTCQFHSFHTTLLCQLMLCNNKIFLSSCNLFINTKLISIIVGFFCLHVFMKLQRNIDCLKIQYFWLLFSFLFNCFEWNKHVSMFNFTELLLNIFFSDWHVSNMFTTFYVKQDK